MNREATARGFSVETRARLAYLRFVRPLTRGSFPAFDNGARDAGSLGRWADYCRAYGQSRGNVEEYMLGFGRGTIA